MEIFRGKNVLDIFTHGFNAVHHKIIVLLLDEFICDISFSSNIAILYKVTF